MTATQSSAQMKSQVAICDHTVAVVMTHNYLDDLEILRFLLPSTARYIGVLGPKRRTEQLLTDLQMPVGVWSNKLYAPLGLDIGADTPDEIALAIVAEIQAVVANRAGGFLKHRQGSIHYANSSNRINYSGSRSFNAHGHPEAIAEVSKTQPVTTVAITSSCRPVVVVLGAYINRIQPEVNNLDLHIVENKQWAAIMGTSIRVGLSALTAIESNLAAVVLVLCDQPFVSTELLQQLVEVYTTTASSIVACEYAGTIGVPVLFCRQWFAQLIVLEGATGAKQLIGQHLQLVHRIPFAAGEVDLDTPNDYQQFLQHEHRLA